MKIIFYLAAAIVFVGTLATCHAGPLEDFVAARATLDPMAIRGELKRPVVSYETNTVNRTTRAQENQLKALVVTNLLTEAQWSNAGLRDERIDAALDARMGRAGITDAEWIALAKIQSRVDVLRRRIARAGGDATGEDAGKLTRQVVTEVVGPPRWQALGMATLPTVEEIKAARGG